MRGIIFFLLFLFFLPRMVLAGDREKLELYNLLSEETTAKSEQLIALKKYFKPEALISGEAVAAYGGNFTWALRSNSEPYLYINDKPVRTMRQISEDLWVYTQQLRAGRSHAHFYRVEGEILGGRRFDTPAYTEDSYPQPNTKKGELSEQLVLISSVYRGWKISYWVYASPGVKPNIPSPVMVWQDGHRFIHRNKRSRLITVVENLVDKGKIPPMILVLVAPGFIGDLDDSKYVPNERVREMRSILYDTVNDDYNKMILAEILPKVEADYNLRSDGYSRAIAGQSSGGICAFNAAWWRPDAFSRVLSRIGSYTPLQWLRGQENSKKVWGLDNPAGLTEGGDIYPTLVRRLEKRNIRIWLEDGSYDLEIIKGSWPLQNIRLANSLKMRGYDFNFSFGNAQHNTTHGNAELPQALTWLWRDYDHSKTQQDFTMDPLERKRPYFRVEITNR